MQYLENKKITNNNSTSYTYDANGNITTLTRHGKMSDGTYNLVDNLILTYNGNQLTKVTDAVKVPTAGGSMDFVDKVNLTQEYTYDANGNMTSDLNKGITSITYNVLNLPAKVSFSNGASIMYTYDANGNKLKTIHKSASKTHTTEYCGNHIYDNGTLVRTLFDGGYITYSGTTPQYHYFITDHQGNIRLVADASGTAEQVTHYYPYGLPFADGKNANHQPYKYNGKELDTEDGLNLYNYGARHYDAALCRWNGMDALAEKNNSQSPYRYCIGNPILFVDPCGKDTFRVSDNSRITQIQGGNNDVFINDNGKIITTTKERSANLINTDDKPFDILNFSNDKNAEKVFKAIADQSKNEWSLIETKGKGYISTSYKPSEELGGRHILSNKNYYIGLYNPILRHIHSHPKSMTLEPSGVDGDIGLVRYFMNVAGFEKTQWYIYGPQAGYFIQYHHNRDIMFKYIDEVFPWSR